MDQQPEHLLARHGGKYSLSTIFASIDVGVDVDVGDIAVEDGASSGNKAVGQLRRHANGVPAQVGSVSDRAEVLPTNSRSTHAMPRILAIRPVLVKSNPLFTARTDGQVNETSPPPRGG